MCFGRKVGVQDRGVAPVRAFRTPRSAGVEVVAAVGVQRRGHDFHRAEVPVRTFVAVGEHHDLSVLDPARVVLAVKNAVRRGTPAIGLGVSPTIHEVAAGSRSLGIGHAVVQNPQFIEIAGADHDLVQLFIVGDGVGVQPVSVVGCSLVIHV